MEFRRQIVGNQRKKNKNGPKSVYFREIIGNLSEIGEIWPIPLNSEESSENQRMKEVWFRLILQVSLFQ